MTTTQTASRRRSGTPTKRVRARSLHLTNLELRAGDALPDGVAGVVTGIALVYGVRDSYGTTFAPGAVDRTRREKVAAGKVPVFLDHDYGVRMHVGYVKALETAGDSEVMTAWLFDTEDGRRAKEYLSAVIRAGGRTGLSIGFWDRASEWITDDDGDRVLRYDEIELEEISITPRPAVPGTAITGVRREATPDVFRHALAAIRDALGPDEFTALVSALEDGADEGDTASHTDAPEDSADAADTDTRDAEGAETRAYATMEERLMALRLTY